MKTLILRTVAVIGGLFIGGVAGGYAYIQRYDRNHPLEHAFAMTGIVSAVSENEYDKDSSDAKGALLTSLNIYSSAVTSSRIDQSAKNAFRMKRGLTEARLSVIENEAGNVSQAKAYLTRAQGDLRAVGWVDTSDANILQVVKRMPPAPCGSTPQNAAGATGLQKPCG